MRVFSFLRIWGFFGFQGYKDWGLRTDWCMFMRENQLVVSVFGFIANWTGFWSTIDDWVQRITHTTIHDVVSDDKMPGWRRWRWWRWSRLHTPSIGLHRGFLRGKMSPKCTWLLYGDQDKDGDERQSGQKYKMNISLKDTKIYSRIPSLYVSKNQDNAMFTLNVFQYGKHIYTICM